jgi:hypothetical protein
MDAPTYLPAVTFEQPVAAPFQLSAQTVSIGELMCAPAAWAIVIKYAPMMKFIVNTAQVKPYLNNLTFDTFVNIGVINQKAVDAINQDLSRLPRNEWPVQ